MCLHHRLHRRTAVRRELARRRRRGGAGVAARTGRLCLRWTDRQRPATADEYPELAKQRLFARPEQP